jgi:Ni2+-binding GTPase involved in maturation of urease and hydrogenase
MASSKLPPQNIEAEQSLLCTFLLGEDPEPAVQILDVEDFYKTGHQHIWTAIISLYKNKEPLGLVEVTAELKSMGKLEESGGAGYLASLMDMPAAVDIQHTAKLIKACSVRRRMIAIANEIGNQAYDDTADIGKLVDTARTDIETIAVVGGYKKLDKISTQVEEWVFATSGQVMTSDCNRDLNFVTPEQKRAANMAFLRLKERGIIEKCGDRNGCYRLIDQGQNDDMDFIEGDIYEYPVKLPFGLNDICSLYPQNIVIIAGSKSAGKTALLLKIVMDNQKTHDIVYLNSEMGPIEWSKRMKGFGCEKKSDIKFKAKSCHKNFHDKIDESNKIYVVDFLEIHDNFFEIAGLIRKIHEKLRDGICFIAIQKKIGEKIGRGADFSMEKARLYLTMEFEEKHACTKLTIIDAKANKTNSDVRGLSKRLKIRDGSNITALSNDWARW